MGLLMLEHVQWIMDQLQDDSNILNMTRLTEDNLDRSQTSPRGPEFIDLDDITWLYDPKFTTPSARLSTGVSTQPGAIEAL